MPSANTVAGNRFAIDGKIGEGATGEVMRATDLRLNRQVALKVLHAHMLPTHAGLARAHREAELLARIDHPNVVRLFDVVQIDGRLALVLELLAGGSLADRIARGRVPLAEAWQLGDQILSGLGAIHAIGAVHRDLKPANVLIDDTGRAKIADLGIARDTAQPGLTRVDARLGTPGYMSPEQLHGGNVDARSDLYAAGVVLCELLAGTQPDGFGRAPLSLAAQAVGDVTVLDRALQTEPAQRWQSAGQMQAAWRAAAIQASGGPVQGAQPANQGVWQLRVMGGAGPDKTFAVKAKLFLGRKEPGQISADTPRAEFADTQMSFNHCTVVQLADGQLAVYDDGSRNGTWVDEVRVGDGAILQAGSVLRCGRTRFRIDRG